MAVAPRVGDIDILIRAYDDERAVPFFARNRI